MGEPVFLVAFIIAAGTVVMVVKTIAGAFGARNTSADYNALRDVVDQQASALEDTQHALEGQASQIAELQERVDFAERLLAQQRERAALRPGDKQE